MTALIVFTAFGAILYALGAAAARFGVDSREFTVDRLVQTATGIR
jgi:hypothetical protein